MYFPKAQQKTVMCVLPGDRNELSPSPFCSLLFGSKPHVRSEQQRVATEKPSSSSALWLCCAVCFLKPRTLQGLLSFSRNAGPPITTSMKTRCPGNQHERKANEVAQLCPVLCDPMDCSPPVSSVHGIFQAGILEWVAISSSRGPS